MTQSLPRKADIYFLKNVVLPNWTPSNTVGFDPTVGPTNEAFLDSADSFDKTGDGYPQFTIQTTGEESSGGESSYDYITSSGPGQNRNGTLTAQVRVEEKTDGSGYTGDSNNFNAVDAERLAVLIRQEIERICQDNASASGTEFSFVGSNANHIPDDPNDTTVTRREGATISYGFLRDSL